MCREANRLLMLLLAILVLLILIETAEQLGRLNLGWMLTLVAKIMWPLLLSLAILIDGWLTVPIFDLWTVVLSEVGNTLPIVLLRMVVWLTCRLTTCVGIPFP